MHYLWEDRQLCVAVKKLLQGRGIRAQIWSLQDGEGNSLYVEISERYVDNLGWFLVFA
jgi:hypothetical protein